MGALSFAIQVLTSIPGLISAGIDVVDMINKTTDDLNKMQAENRDPTDEEWDALNKIIEELRAKISDINENTI